MKRLCYVLLAMMVNFNVFAACPTTGGYSITSGSTALASITTASIYAAPNWITSDPGALKGILGTNVVQGTEDRWVLGGLDTKLAGSGGNGGVRAKSLRYFGGERSRVINANGDYVTQEGAYAGETAASTTLDPKPHSYTDPTSMTYKKIINHAKTIGAERIYFVVNVQEAFARCLPTDTSTNAACTLFENGNLDNTDPDDGTHYGDLSTALIKFGEKAASLAGWVRDYARSADVNYLGEIVFEIGNENGLDTLAPKYYSLKDRASQYNMAVFRYASRIRSKDRTYKIAANGPFNNNAWWTAIDPANYDYISVHNNYGMSPFINPAYTTNVNCTSPAVGKLSSLNVCRTEQWPGVKTGKDVFDLSYTVGKPVAVTEFNSAATVAGGSTWWLDPTPAIVDVDSALNAVVMIGEFSNALPVSPYGILDAMLWPAMSTGDANDDYRSMFKYALPYVGTWTQAFFRVLNDATAGTFQGIAYSANPVPEIVVWQSQLGAYRKIVIVNGSTNNIKVPVTMTTAATTIYATGDGANESAISCNFPASSSFTVIVRGKSISQLSVWH